MAQICRRHGVHYARILPSTIYAEPRWANVCELLRYKSVELTPELTFQAIDLLSRRNGTTTIAKAQAILGGRELGLPRIYAMALQKLIELNLSKPLGMQTTIRLLAENAVHK